MAEIAGFESLASFFNTLLTACKVASGYALRDCARAGTKKRTIHLLQNRTSLFARDSKRATANGLTLQLMRIADRALSGFLLAPKRNPACAGSLIAFDSDAGSQLAAGRMHAFA